MDEKDISDFLAAARLSYELELVEFCLDIQLDVLEYELPDEFGNAWIKMLEEVPMVATSFAKQVWEAAADEETNMDSCLIAMCHKNKLKNNRKHNAKRELQN